MVTLDCCGEGLLISKLCYKVFKFFRRATIILSYRRWQGLPVRLNYSTRCDYPSLCQLNTLRDIFMGYEIRGLFEKIPTFSYHQNLSRHNWMPQINFPEICWFMTIRDSKPRHWPIPRENLKLKPKLTFKNSVDLLKVKQLDEAWLHMALHRRANSMMPISRTIWRRNWFLIKK